MTEEWGGPVAPPVALAGFWIRFAALLIDSVLVLVVTAALVVLVGNTGGYVGLLVSFAYHVGFFGVPRGQTPGYMATGLQLVSKAGGDPIGPGRAAVRWVVGLISGYLLFLGYLWMIWDVDKQTWHDKAAGSLVVRTTPI